MQTRTVLGAERDALAVEEVQTHQFWGASADQPTCSKLVGQKNEASSEDLKTGRAAGSEDCGQHPGAYSYGELGPPLGAESQHRGEWGRLQEDREPTVERRADIQHS